MTAALDRALQRSDGGRVPGDPGPAGRAIGPRATRPIRPRRCAPLPRRGDGPGAGGAGLRGPASSTTLRCPEYR
ncbi:hypothetical protein HBB16_10240 [Pseudonocardia sp. MCCB 268]|nr:hypothetical protein [Pseudonocardia cytotoxica]